MHKYGKKPQQQGQYAGEQIPQRAGGRPKASFQQMASLMGNQAMLSALGYSGQERSSETPFSAQLRARFEPASTRSRPVALDSALLQKAEERYHTPLDGLRAFEDAGLTDSGFNGYAQGRDIHIDGSLSPSEKERVTLHEIGHVIQRGSGMARGSGFLDDPALEQAADTGFSAPQGFTMPASGVGPVMGDPDKKRKRASSAPPSGPVSMQVPTSAPVSAQVPASGPVSAQVPTSAPVSAQVPASGPVSAQVPASGPVSAQVPASGPVSAQVPVSASATALEPPSSFEDLEYLYHGSEIDANSFRKHGLMSAIAFGSKTGVMVTGATGRGIASCGRSVQSEHDFNKVHLTDDVSTARNYGATTLLRVHKSGLDLSKLTLRGSEYHYDETIQPKDLQFYEPDQVYDEWNDEYTPDEDFGNEKYWKNLHDEKDEKEDK